MTSYSYDAFDRVTAVAEAYGTSLQRTTTYTYEPGDQVATITNPRGYTTTAAHDALGRLAAPIATSGRRSHRSPADHHTTT